MGKLFLIPNTLGDSNIHGVLPSEVIARIKNIKIFASENPKNTRRFLKQIDKSIVLEELTFLELNEHSDRKAVEACLPYLEKEDVGIISEAGCPGIADPGAELVALAHRKAIQVVPLVGPSSILLALIASGCNGQSQAENRTQIFIETPYRNLKLFEEMLQVLHPQTLLSIACDITTENEYIRTMSIQDWKKQKPDINKRPAIFLIYASTGIKTR